MDTEIEWLEIKIVMIPEAVDAVTGILYDIDIGGLSIEDPTDLSEIMQTGTEWDYISDELLCTDVSDATIKAYISKDAEAKNKISFIEEKLNEIRKYFNTEKIFLEVRNVKEKNWFENWKKYYKPLKITERLIVKPTWEPYEKQKADDIIIEMDPGLAFGTGDHETTRMCMQILEYHVKEGVKVLDIGCGSGILGITALKLGAKTCVGVDFDNNAIKTARENAKINGVKDKIVFKEGNLLDVVSGKYDVIVANIVADAIIELSKATADYLNPDGIFIASGIIRQRYDEVKAHLIGQNYSIINELFMEEWVAVAVKGDIVI
jgi:ribosomal protein L11 methyltransferase